MEWKVRLEGEAEWSDELGGMRRDLRVSKI
jgi:hypothetical protein